MLNHNSVITLFFGVILGTPLGIFHNRFVHNGKSYDLSQELKRTTSILVATLLAIEVAIIWLTPLEFEWSYFLVGLFGTAVPLTLLSQGIFTGRISWRYASAFRSLYRYEPYRYSAHQSPIMPLWQIFEPQPGMFSTCNALVCAHLSLLSYGIKEDANRIAEKWQCSAMFLEDAPNACLVVGDSSAIVAAFRGTASAKDWATNLNLLSHSRPWGSVHLGFSRALDRLWGQFVEALKKLHISGQRLWLTGHSLGGALATLAAERLIDNEPPFQVEGIYTFGQPRVASSAFCKEFNCKYADKMFRFVACRDDIPNQPPTISTHFGTLQYFDRHGNLHTDPSQLRMFWDGLSRDPVGLAPDHSMSEYLRLVEGLFVQTYEQMEGQIKARA